MGMPGSPWSTARSEPEVTLITLIVRARHSDGYSRAGDKRGPPGPTLGPATEDLLFTNQIGLTGTGLASVHSPGCASAGCTERGLSTTVRFIHTADLQLGMTRRFLDDDAQARYAQARIDGLTAIGRIAVAEKAEFVVVAGDVFETNRVRPRTVGRALQAMESIPVPVFLLPGNHDPLDAATVYRSPTFLRSVPPNVVVLDGSDPVDVRDGVQVVGAPWTTKRPLLDLVAAACEPLVADPAFTCGSSSATAPVDFRGEFHDPATIRLAAAEAAIADGKVQYIALGDRHSTTQVGETGRIWYAGAPEPTAHDETDAGNVLLVELEDGRCTVTPTAGRDLAVCG